MATRIWLAKIMNSTSYSKLEEHIHSTTDKEIYVIAKIPEASMEELFILKMNSKKALRK